MVERLMEKFTVTPLNPKIQIKTAKCLTILTIEEAQQLIIELTESINALSPQKMFLGEWEEAQRQFKLGLIDYIELQRIKNK